MRIAIVDDIASERETLKGRVTAQTVRLSLDAAVSCYASGTDFLACAGKEHFDLVFLAIYLEAENGMDTAEALRRFDPDCLLVFTTTSPDHALEGFRVRALHYLVKLCSRGVLVNMEHAEDFDGTGFLLKNGNRISVSRGLAKAARTAFGDYLFNDFKSSGRRD